MPDATTSGSTCVACWLVLFVYGSVLSRTTLVVWGGGGVGPGTTLCEVHAPSKVAHPNNMETRRVRRARDPVIT